MSGIHERRPTFVGRIAALIVRHPIRFQTLGGMLVTLLLGIVGMGQPSWRIAAQVVGFAFCLWFGGTAALLNYRARRRSGRRASMPLK